MSQVFVEVGAGELIDKITILQIKLENISDAEKLKNISYELSVLEKSRDAALPASPELVALTNRLKEINQHLWVIEDDIRACESAGDFGPSFIALARAVYQTNDRRAAVKKEINLLTGATIVEEKSYQEY